MKHGLALILLMTFGACDGAKRVDLNENEENQGSTPTAEEKKEDSPEPLGPEAVGESYRVVVKVEEKYQQGAQSFALALTPRGKWHVNKDYPISLNVKSIQRTTNLLLPQQELDANKATKIADEEASFEVPFSAKAEGKFEVEAELSFAMCTPKTCVQEDAKVLALLNVGMDKAVALE